MPAYPSTFLPSGGDTPITTPADVLAEYPLRVRQEPVAPVRDAAAELQTEIFLEYQLASAYAAAQSDPTRATGVYLEEFTTEVGIFRQDGEEDESLRTRLFSPPAVVTPQAIKAAVNALLEPVTNKQCILWESVADRLYVSNGDATWSSFIGDGVVVMDPDYPDRRWALRGACMPGGAFTFNEGEGRYFILRVPDLSEAANAAAYVIAPADRHNDWELDVDDGAGSYPTFVFAGGNSATTLYATIINTVESIRGHGVRWMMIVDTKL